MHAHLLINPSNKPTKSYIDKILNKTKSKLLPFEVQKIDDARQLLEFTKLKLGQPTTIYIESIDTASSQAQNTLLKTIEEPQASLSFVLTAKSINNIPNTILSRCKIINIHYSDNNKQNNLENARNFLNFSVGEKFTKTSTIKSKDDAIKFLVELQKGAHILLQNDPNLHTNLTHIDKAISNMQANGNVQLQLTNLVTHLV